MEYVSKAWMIINILGHIAEHVRLEDCLAKNMYKRGKIQFHSTLTGEHIQFYFEVGQIIYYLIL